MQCVCHKEHKTVLHWVNRMHMGKFVYQGRTCWGAVTVDGNVVPMPDVPWVVGDADTDVMPAALRSADQPPIDASKVEWLPPVQPTSKIVCVGLNYQTHVAESGRKQAEYPSLFLRHTDSFVGHGQAIVKPSCSQQFDYEGELVVVIGRKARHVSEDTAMDYVAGYTCMGENSVRDFQKHTAQVTAGKNFEHSGSLGPWIASRDNVPDPAELTVTTRLNGHQVQHGLVADLIFPIPRLITYISTFMTLEPGDLIATGTPEGVGFRRTPPLFMQPGDVLEVEVSGVGVLRTPVITEP